MAGNGKEFLYDPKIEERGIKRQLRLDVINFLNTVVEFFIFISYYKNNRTPRTSHVSDVSHGETFFFAEKYEDYYKVLDAPYKEIVWFEHSGHDPWINENNEFVKKLNRVLNAK